MGVKLVPEAASTRSAAREGFPAPAPDDDEDDDDDETAMTPSLFATTKPPEVGRPDPDPDSLVDVRVDVRVGDEKPTG